MKTQKAKTENGGAHAGLALAPGADPKIVAQALVVCKDHGQVKAVMNSLAPEEAARIVAGAAGVREQSKLIWCLEKPKRAAVLDRLAPLSIAALIQNQERRNRHLLGDISLEHFARILEFCSPRQRYYWLSLAASFADVSANLLPVLLSPEQVAETLLTEPEFRRKLPLLHQWIAGGFESAPPVTEPRLQRLMARLAEYDADRYYEVVTTAQLMLDRNLALQETNEALEEEPVVLERIPMVPPLLPTAQSLEETAKTDGIKLRDFLPMPISTDNDLLLRSASKRLPPARRHLLEQEMERAFEAEVLAGGGSLEARDLEAAAARLQAYVRLGLKDVPEQPEQIAAVLAKVRLQDIIQRGTVVLEQLRQIALRLRPFVAMLDVRQRDLLDALIRPKATTIPEDGAPALLVAAVDRRRRAQAIPVSTLQDRLMDITAWVAIARALGLRTLTEKLAASANGSQAVTAALAVSLLCYDKWDPQALESAVLRQFRDRYFDRERKCWRPDTVAKVRDAVVVWADCAGLEAAMRPRVLRCVMEALARLEKFLRTHRVVAWDRFAPGKRARKQRAEMFSLEEAEAEELMAEAEEEPEEE